MKVARVVIEQHGALIHGTIEAFHPKVLSLYFGTQIASKITNNPFSSLDYITEAEILLFCKKCSY